MLNKNLTLNQFVGRLAREPEVKETANGKLLLTFVLAYNTRRTTDSEGSHSNFIPVECWESLTRSNYERLQKGMQVVVKGDLVQSRWEDTEGNRRSRFRICADAVEISDLWRRPEQAEATAEAA